MHPSIDMLEQVVRLSRHEFELLERDDAEGLVENANLRERLLQDAWLGKAGCDEMEFSGLLRAIQDLQNKLDERATTLMRQTRAELEEHRGEVNERKKTTQGILGYCKVGLDRPQTNARIFRKFS